MPKIVPEATILLLVIDPADDPDIGSALGVDWLRFRVLRIEVADVGNGCSVWRPTEFTGSGQGLMEGPLAPDVDCDGWLVILGSDAGEFCAVRGPAWRTVVRFGGTQWCCIGAIPVDGPDLRCRTGLVGSCLRSNKGNRAAIGRDLGISNACEIVHKSTGIE